MSEPIDYRLANLKNRQLKLRAQRGEILASDSEEALDKILDAPSPATLVQSFPDQDLYYMMHKIGPYDFTPVLSMATSDQWEYILDMEAWDTDRLDLETTTKIFDLLFQADPKRLLRWGIQKKPAFFEYYLSKHLSIKVREHDEPPPSDFDDYITIDDKFYFRFPEKPLVSDDHMPSPRDSQPAWELVEKMLKLLAEMDLSVFHGLLQETDNLLPAELEEEEFRLKNLRLAERGFLPTHEAIGIYQPAGPDQLRRRPKKPASSKSFDPDIPLPPQFFTGHLDEKDLFVQALHDLDPEFLTELESETAALINKVISADKIKLRSRGHLEKATIKTHAYLNLGLEILLEENLKPAQARELISKYYLEDIFRIASTACIKLKTAAAKWFETGFMHKNRLPLSFLDETYLGVVGGLFIDRPMFFDNYRTHDLYRDFRTRADISITRNALDEVMALDSVLDRLTVDTDSFREGILTYKTLLLTLWARERLNLPPTLEPIDITVFKDFFTALFSRPGQKRSHDIRMDDLLLWICEATGSDEKSLPGSFVRVIENLMRELDREYGSVQSRDLDPRFMPHFLLK